MGSSVRPSEAFRFVFLVTFRLGFWPEEAVSCAFLLFFFLVILCYFWPSFVFAFHLPIERVMG